MKSRSDNIASFVRNFSLRTAPAEVTEKAKQIALDTIGVALASSTMDFGRMVIDLALTLGGPKSSRLIGTSAKVGAANAVLANGTLAHGLDYDDTLEEAIVHTGCCAVMTSLAVGEEVGASGKMVLEAAISGIEVMCKIGLVAPGSFHKRAFHPTALCSTFGAAAAAGRLLGLSQLQMVNAFGICGSQSSGIIEYLADGSWTKRFHPAWSSHGGIIAALLARRGFLGPVSVFEGEHGFYRAFAGSAAGLERLNELGKSWETPRIAFKSYPCGSISHPYMDCALKLKKDHQIDPAAVEEVVCRTAEGPVHRLWEPLSEKQSPSTSYGAKFSLPYSIAVVLTRGRAGLEEFSDAAVRDPEILALAKRVRYELDPTIDYPRHFSGHVKIKLKDGATFEANQPHPRGGMEDPLPRGELEEKFLANARLVLPKERARTVLSLLRDLERVQAITDLTNLLAPH